MSLALVMLLLFTINTNATILHTSILTKGTALCTITRSRFSESEEHTRAADNLCILLGFVSATCISSNERFKFVF